MKGREKKKEKEEQCCPCYCYRMRRVRETDGKFSSMKLLFASTRGACVADADADQILWSMGSTRMAPLPGWKDRKRIAKHLHCIMNHSRRR